MHTSSSAGAPGEAMHGMAFKNRTVAEVKPMLARRDLAVDWYNLAGRRNGVTIVQQRSVPDTWYVHDATSVMPGLVQLWVGPESSARCSVHGG